jgi:hypothetical protein
MRPPNDEAGLAKSDWEFDLEALWEKVDRDPPNREKASDPPRTGDQGPDSRGQTST